MRIPIADAVPELREQLRPHQRAATASSDVRERRPSCRSEPAVERETRLHAAQLHHPRDGRAPPPAAPSSPSRSTRCARAPASAASRCSSAAGPPGPRPVGLTRTSAAMIARASLISPLRTLWITDRSATIAPTPIATQTKKNSSRRHDARSSRAAIRRTKVMRRSASAAGRAVVRTTRPSRSANRVGHRRELRIVRDQHQRRAARAVDLEQQIDDLTGRWRCRDCPSARRRAGSADRWRAPARSRRAAARRPRAATDSDGRGPTGRLRRAAPSRAPPAFAPGNLHRHEHVLERRQRRQQVKELEHEADPLAAQPRQRVLVERRDVDAVDDDAPGRRRIETGQQPEQRRLAAARRPGDRDDAARLDARSSGWRIVSIGAARHRLGDPAQLDHEPATSGRAAVRAPSRRCRPRSARPAVGMDAVAWFSAGFPATLSSRNGMNSTRVCSATSRNACRNARRVLLARSSAAPPCPPEEHDAFALALDDRREVLFHLATGRPRRPSLPPSATIRTDVALERPVEPAQAARRRVAGDAGVDDLELVAVRRASLQQRRIRLCSRSPRPMVRLSPSHDLRTVIRRRPRQALGRQRPRPLRPSRGAGGASGTRRAAQHAGRPARRTARAWMSNYRRGVSWSRTRKQGRQ